MSKTWKMNDVLAAAAWYDHGTFAEDAASVGVEPEENLLVSAFDFEDPASDRIRGIEVVESWRLEILIWIYQGLAAGRFYAKERPGAGYRILDVRTTDAGLVRVGVVCAGGSESPKYIDRLDAPYDDRAGLFYFWGQDQQRDYPWWTCDVLDILWHVENPDFGDAD